MGIKVTMFFSMQNFGWTESHFYLGAGAAIDSFDNQARALAKARSALLGAKGPDKSQGAPILTTVRISNDTIYRDSHIVTLNEVDGGPLNMIGSIKAGSVPGSNVADFENVAIKIRAESGVLKRAFFYLCGVPQGVNEFGNVVNLGGVAGFPDLFGQFRSILTTGGSWGFRSKVIPAVAGPTVPIGLARSIAITREAVDPGRLVITNATIAGVVAGSYVTLKNWTMRSRSYQPVNGTYQVGAVSAGNAGQALYTLNGTEGRDPTEVVGLGAMFAVSYEYLPYTNVFATSIVSRKRGVGSEKPHGRRRSAPVFLP
jgi:hypothetical protein